MSPLWIGVTVMARRVPHIIDLNDAPDLPWLIKLVRETQAAVVIRHDGEDGAILSPTGAETALGIHHEVRQADIETALSVAGGWSGHLDVDAFLRENYARRDRSTRPSVAL
jgi:hypothetical protein